MNITRLSALLLFTLMLIPIGASAHCKGKHDVEGHPHCGPGDPTDPGDSIEYSVALTGAFLFNAKIDSVESKGSVLRSADPVTLTRPTVSALEMIWDNVFEQCRNFFEPTPVIVPSFTAPPGNKGWTVEKPGGVRVNFRSIPFSVSNANVDGIVEVTLALIGTTPFAAQFLPADPSNENPITTRTHSLSRFWIYGKTAKGVTPRIPCNDGNVDGEGTFPLENKLSLVITASLPPE